MGRHFARSGVKRGSAPGEKLQIYPSDLTYSTLVMWWNVLGQVYWRRVRRVRRVDLGFPGRGSLIHAPDTPGTGRIKIQPGAADFITAYEAITVVTCIHAMQCAVDFL